MVIDVAASGQRPSVFVIDDDDDVRTSPPAPALRDVSVTHRDDLLINC